MHLNQLTQALPTVLGQVGGDAIVHGIAADSRSVHPGDLFVAVSGVSVDGHRFIADAVDNGAVAVIGERSPQTLPHLPWGAFTYVRVPDSREALGWLCAAWEGFPSRRMTLVGVTGTEGKTTTVALVHSILQAAGLSASMISTVSARIGNEELDTGLHTTTPNAPEMQRYLHQMVESGSTHAVLEVTSHGLAQHRVAGCDFDVAVITNITHEHLDYHGTFDEYRAAKTRLFTGLRHSSRKSDIPKIAVLNRDDESYSTLRELTVERQIVYGMTQSADLWADSAAFSPEYTRFELHTPKGDVPIETALVGDYNVGNILAAASVGIALKLDLDAIRLGVAAVKAVPGRMERIVEGQDFTAIVDFAHTPNALDHALRTARTMTGDGRVIAVFGCAGLRDREKRTAMGTVAAELADLVIITAEDPRTEDLDEIMSVTARAMIVRGRQEGVHFWRVPDRGEAILLACQRAKPGDVVIACGKGHEQSMCFGTIEYPWDDRTAMREALRGQSLGGLPTSPQRRVSS
ncbi:MAG: UDP-N-acetylmuramoyl-L-alanyl-D-glutamate--2,6-diaminopimelate ligase [Chloroflexi bacterium]|nr:UDP-N-acetylmuramoyl-L-alanyl-D-glutamate--2,6-diaminopimelate ligase [Chloroflexota bacterium]